MRFRRRNNKLCVDSMVQSVHGPIPSLFLTCDVPCAASTLFEWVRVKRTMVQGNGPRTHALASRYHSSYERRGKGERSEYLVILPYCTSERVIPLSTVTRDTTSPLSYRKEVSQGLSRILPHRLVLRDVAWPWK